MPPTATNFSQSIFAAWLSIAPPYDSLIAQVGSLKLSTYRSLAQAFLRIEATIRKSSQQKFHEAEFQTWKDVHQKEFLTQKRKEEKEKKTYARPYLDYLHEKERALFKIFWEENRLTLTLKALLQSNELISSEIEKEPLLQTLCKSLKPELAEEFLHTFRSFSQLERPLLGFFQRLSHAKGEQTEKDLAAAFYPREGFGFTRSYAFQATAPQGSIFKIVTAYEGLRQGHTFSLIDELGQDPKIPSEKGQIVAYSLNKTPYPRLYKGGRLPRSGATQIGKIDLLGAIEHSSNPYFSILAGDYFKDPEDLCRTASLLGYGEKTEIELPGEAKGKIPSDLKTNRTGLYSTAIGQHTLLSTPLQAVSMLAAFANGGRLLKPTILKKSTSKLKREIPLLPHHRTLLLEGMNRSIWSPKGSVRPTVIKNLLNNPLLMRDYLSLQHQMVGKSSTAQILFNPHLNPSAQAQLYKHIWFGAISFDQNSSLTGKSNWENPELVVVVFLRFGDAGKEAAPIAAQVIRKWREIKQRHGE